MSGNTFQNKQVTEMVSRKRVAPIEDDDTMEDKQEGEENNLQEPQIAPNALASSLSLQISTVEFHRRFTPPSPQLRQDRNTLSLQSENERRSRIHSPNSAGMKRRNSNLANCEKMLQEINASAGDANAIPRKENSQPYEAILELKCEVNEENEEEGGAKVPGENGDEGGHLSNLNDLNRPDGIKKPDDPNQALLLYFAKLSSSSDVDDALDLEHIQSLLHAGASVNTSDRFGQTLLHEVSRTWGIDVAQFFIDQGEPFSQPSLFLC